MEALRRRGQLGGDAVITLSLTGGNDASRSLERPAAGDLRHVAGERDCVRAEPSRDPIIGDPSSFEPPSAIRHTLALQGLQSGTVMQRQAYEARQRILAAMLSSKGAPIFNRCLAGTPMRPAKFYVR